MSQKLEEQMKLLLEKVDRVLSLLQTRSIDPRPRALDLRARKEKQKVEPPSGDEVASHRTRFESLFECWDAGEELQVEKELDKMKADELRRFADANNLNVTSKTPKQKVMQLVAGRFRERRHLMRSHFARRPPPE